MTYSLTVFCFYNIVTNMFQFGIKHNTLQYNYSFFFFKSMSCIMCDWCFTKCFVTHGRSILNFYRFVSRGLHKAFTLSATTV